MIRNASQADLDFIYGLYMHPQVNPYLLYEKMEKEDFRPIYDKLLESGVKYIYSDGKKRVGMFKLIPQTHRNDHICYLGGLAIHPLFGGKGEGGKMMKEILALAISRQFLRIELSVATINWNAISLYKKLGFEEEGLLRKYTYLKQEGKFLDELLMARSLTTDQD